MNFVQPLFKFNIVLLYRQHIDPCGLALSLFNMYLLFTFQKQMKHNAAYQHERERYNSRREKNP